MARWAKGHSGNPKGRPKVGTAVAGLARSQLAKHRLIEKLGRTGAGEDSHGNVDVGQQIRAIQLLLAYGYGPPMGEIESGDGVVIQVTYVERNPIAINGPTPGATAGDPAGQTVQRGLLRAPVGQDGPGNGSLDSPGTAG